MDDVGGPRRREIGTDDIIEELGQKGREGMYGMFEEFCLKVFNVGCLLRGKSLGGGTDEGRREEV